MFFHSEQKKDLSIDSILSDKLNLMRVEVADRFGEAELDVEFIEKLYNYLLDIHKDDKAFASENLYREVVNVKNALAQGVVSFTPDLSTPESQLLWGAAMAYISQNPQVMQNWKGKYQAEKLSLTPLWQSVSNSPEALRVIKNHSFMIAGSFKNKETKIVWSEPDTGYPNVGYCFIPAENVILDDLLWSLIVGLDNSKAALLHEVGHSQGSTEFPEKVKKLQEELEPLYKVITEQDWHGKEAERTEKIVEFNKKKNEYNFLFMFYDEMENNYANAYVTRQKGQDYNQQINVVESCICGAGSRYLKSTKQEKVLGNETFANDLALSETEVVSSSESETATEDVLTEVRRVAAELPASDEQVAVQKVDEETENGFLKQFINLKRTVRNSFFKNNGFFEDTAEGWKKVGVDLEKLDGFDANGNRLTHEEAFKDLMEQCQKLEKLQVSRRDQLFGRDYYNRRVSEYCRERNEIIEQVFERYVSPFLKQEMQKMADQIREEQKQNASQAQNSQQQNQTEAQQNQQIDQQMQQQLEDMIEKAKQDQKREIGQKQPQMPMPSLMPQKSQLDQKQQPQNQQAGQQQDQQPDQSGQSQGQQSGQNAQSQGEAQQGQSGGQQQAQAGQSGNNLDNKTLPQQDNAQDTDRTMQKNAKHGEKAEQNSSAENSSNNASQQEKTGPQNADAESNSSNSSSVEKNVAEENSADASSQNGDAAKSREQKKETEEANGRKDTDAEFQQANQKSTGENNRRSDSANGLEKHDFENQDNGKGTHSASTQEQKNGDEAAQKAKNQPAENENSNNIESRDQKIEKQKEDAQSSSASKGSGADAQKNEDMTSETDVKNQNGENEKTADENSAEQKDKTTGDDNNSQVENLNQERKGAEGQNNFNESDKNSDDMLDYENKGEKPSLGKGTKESSIQKSEQKAGNENSDGRSVQEQISEKGYSKEQLQKLLEQARMLEELAQEYEEEQESGDDSENQADEQKSWSEQAKIDNSSLRNLAKRGAGGGSTNGEAYFRREGNIEAYKKMIDPYGAIIAQTREMFKRIKEKQKKQLEEISRKMNLLPEDNDVTRFSVEAHKNLLDKMHGGSGLSVKDFERFRTENKKKNVSVTIDVAVLIDGSGSMHGAPFHNALVAGCIIFEAAKNIKDVNIYMYMMGNPRPLCIAKPEFSIEEVSKNLERVREGQGSDRDHIMPAIEKFLEDMEKHEQGAKQSENVGASHIFAITDGYNTDRDPVGTNEKIKQLVLGSKYISLDYLFIHSGDWGDVCARDIIDELASNKGSKRIGETDKICRMKQIPPMLLNLLKSRLKETDLTQTPKRYEKNKLTKKLLNKWNEGR